MGAHDAGGHALIVALHDLAPRQDVQHLPVASHHAELGLVLTLAMLHIILKALGDPGFVVRVHMVEKARGHAGQLGVLVPQHGLPAAGEKHLSVAQIPVPDTITSAFQSELPALFGLGQLQQRLALLCDITKPGQDRERLALNLGAQGVARQRHPHDVLVGAAQGQGVVVHDLPVPASAQHRVVFGRQGGEQILVQQGDTTSGVINVLQLPPLHPQDATSRRVEGHHPAIGLQNQQSVGDGGRHRAIEGLADLQLFKGDAPVGDVHHDVHGAAIAQVGVAQLGPPLAEAPFVGGVGVAQTQHPLNKVLRCRPGIRPVTVIHHALQCGWPGWIVGPVCRAGPLLPLAIADHDAAIRIRHHHPEVKAFNRLAQQLVDAAGLLFGLDLSGDIAAGATVAHELSGTVEHRDARHAHHQLASRCVSHPDHVRKRFAASPCLAELLPVVQVVRMRAVDVGTLVTQLGGGVQARVVHQRC